MSLHKRHLLLLLPLLLLLAGLPLVPSMAGAEETPTVEAANGTGPYGEPHSWSRTVVPAPSGVVAFKNPTTTTHGINWTSGPGTPTCSGIPVGTHASDSGKEWTGTCTFAQPGRYEFVCTVHPTEMTGSVFVTHGVITTSTSTTTSSSSGASTTTTTTTSSASTTETPLGPILVGSTAKALKVPRSQRGKAVRGSVDVGAGGAGGKLEVDLLANKAVLAKFVRVRLTRVGRLLRSSLSAGRVSFKVPLNARGKRTLRNRRRLALTVTVVLTPTRGSAVTVTRHATLHA